MDRLASQTTLLTSLVIFLPNDSLALTMPQLFLILTSNPYLRKLKLNPQAIPESDDDGDGSGRVLLHHLEELRLDGDAAGEVFGLLRRLEHPKRVDIVLNLSHCVVPDISQTIAPYLRDYLRRRGRSRRGLGLSLFCGGYTTFTVGNAGRMDLSTSISSRMAPFMSITVGFDQAVPEDVLEKLTLDLIAHTPREEIVYFRTSGNLEAVKDLGTQTPNLKALDQAAQGTFAHSVSDARPERASCGRDVPPLFAATLFGTAREELRLGPAHRLPDPPRVFWKPA